MIRGMLEMATRSQTTIIHHKCLGCRNQTCFIYLNVSGYGIIMNNMTKTFPYGCVLFSEYPASLSTVQFVINNKKLGKIHSLHFNHDSFTHSQNYYMGCGLIANFDLCTVIRVHCAYTSRSPHISL